MSSRGVHLSTRGKLSDVGVVGITVLAPLLGGSIALWAKATLLALMGLLILLRPPHALLPKGLTAVMVALWVLGLAVFLPVNWFADPPLRAELAGTLRTPLPGTLTLQPWHTLESVLVLLAALVWLYYLLVRQWTLSRLALLRIYASGLLLLVVTLLVSYFSGWRPEFWPDHPGLSLFPNRNQTANVLALLGIVALGLLYREMMRGRKAGWFWLVAYVVVGFALALNGSRAGILIFLGGSFIWWILLEVVHPLKMRWRAAIALPLLGLTFFFLFAGETLDRLNEVFAGSADEPSIDFRLLIYQDAWAMGREMPWCGVGQGNFAPIFSLYRNASQTQKWAVHPESDWFWLWLETGWPGLLLVLIGLAWLTARCFPFKSGSERVLRLSAIAAVGLFALHGLVDVSGHRPGSVWPALFLIAMAQHPRARLIAWRGVATLFRTLAMVMISIAVLWFGAIGEMLEFPNSAAIARQKARIEIAMEKRDYATVATLANQLLAWSPLDWQVYYQRGAARTLGTGLVSIGWLDFQRARLLESQTSRLPFSEGKLWVAMNQSALALNAWREALRRAGPSEDGLYAQMLRLAAPDEAMLEGLGELAGSHPERLLMWLGSLPRGQFSERLERVLASAPPMSQWTAAERQRLFALWFQRGNPAALQELLEENPEWLSEGWRWLAQIRAGRDDFAGACELIQQFGSRPAIPESKASQSLDELRLQARRRADDLVIGYALFHAQVRAEQHEEALSTIIRLARQPSAPRYFHYLEMEKWLGQEQWEKAWQAWQRFSR